MNVKYITSCVRSDHDCSNDFIRCHNQKNDERLLFEDVHLYVHIEISSK